ncbi:MAG: ABC transporter ATP-binding protein [Proteobacteria bacterium]|nr:ABC transporter ATP-binding protein [Pseudomonadota bacterium]
MEPNLFRYIWRHSRREQVAILFVVLASLPFYFASLDLPKLIVNDAIQGKAFPPGGPARIHAFAFSVPVPEFLGGGRWTIVEGADVDRFGYLLGLSVLLLLLVIINGAFKYKINIAKGLIGERMLRRMRFDLFRQLFLFRPEEARLIKPAEVSSMIKDEVEPIGGFIGDAFIQPAFLITQAGTALFFIMVQNPLLGMLTALTVALQALIVPALRRKQLILGKERQIESRKLAGKVGEVVDGMPAIRGHGTRLYENADIGGRLGTLFRIRFDLFKRKFAVKYLNNLLSQLTPFLFYTLGGYFALKGSLDVGQLVAVIAAYKDIPPPVKELIDWDQQRNDVTIKYEQVVENFSPPAAIAYDPPVALALSSGGATLDFKNVTAFDNRGTPLLDSVSISLSLPGNYALLDDVGGGKAAFARLLGGQISRYDGSISLAGHPLETMNPQTRTTAIAYAGPDPILFPVSIRENVAYGLRRQVPALKPPETAAEAFRRAEARRTGNPLESPTDDWYEYALAGVADAEGLDAAILDALHTVGLGEDIYRFGLSATLDPLTDLGLAEALVKARMTMHERLDADKKSHLVETFDPERYNSNATIGENLVFGVVLGAGERTIFADESNRRILREFGVSNILAEIGARITETMLEIFADLPAGHAMFEQFSFINAAELPEFESIFNDWRRLPKPVERLDERTARLAILASNYVEPRHRLGLLTPEVKEKIVIARHALHDHWQSSGNPPVELYDPDQYCFAAPVRDNLLFGRVGFGIAGANETIANLIRTTLAELDLQDDVGRLGLNHQAGPGGRLLFQSQCSAIDLARCLLRQPDILIVDRALTSHRKADALAILASIRAKMPNRTVIADLPEGASTEGFDHAIIFENGRIVAEPAP